MSTSKRRRTPVPDRNLLWARSAGRCSAPNCDKFLVAYSPADKTVTLGKLAHIEAHSEGGPRFNPSLPLELIDLYDNLVLLCGDHHDIVDARDSTHTVDELRGWKLSHERKVGRIFDLILVTPPGLPKRNPNFVGRDDILNRIAATSTPSTIALTGLPGAGKTDLAAQYVHQFASRYQFIWWLRAKDRLLLQHDLANCCAAIGIESPPNGDYVAISRLLQAHLQRIPSWLLVFDGAPDETGIRDSVPSGPGGAVLITSQAASWLSPDACITVEALDAGSNRQLLKSRSPRMLDEEATEIAEALGGLPLAVVQAASYISQTGATAQEYLDRLRHHRAEMLARAASSNVLSVAATFAMAFAELSKPAHELLHILSVMSTDPVPVALFSGPSGEGLIPELKSTVQIDEAVADLRRFSLVVRQEGALQLHQLVRDEAQRGIPEFELDFLAARAAIAIGTTLPTWPDRAENWQSYETLLPHVMALSSREGNLEVMGPCYAHLFNRFGAYLAERGDAVQAFNLLTRALSLDGRFGEMSRSAILTNLGTVLMQQGRFDEARDRLREAVASKEASDPPDPQSLAISLGALGQAELRAGSVPAAATCFMRELELLDKDADRTLRAKAASDLADLMNAVGDPFRELGALMQAEELARGDGNMLEVSKCLGRKAHVFSSVGFRQCALDAEEAALSIERDLHGNGSRAVVYRLRNITLLHIEMGNFDRAHEVLDSAGATLEDVEGVSRNHLRGVIEGTRALAIATAGDIPGSHPLFASAVRSLEGDDPNSKRELGMVLSNRGWCLLQLGDPQAAVDDLNRAVDLLDAVGATNIVGKAKGNLKLAMDATRSTAAGRDPTAVI